MNEKKPLSKKMTTSCPVYQKCSGCSGQEEPYDKTLQEKQTRIRKTLEPYCEPEPIIGMDNPYHYRERVIGAYGHDKQGHICGMIDRKTGRVIPMENCSIDDKKATSIILTIKELLKSFKIKTYDVKSGNGLLRYALVRNGYQTGEIMVVLVLSSGIMPSKNNFVKALRKEHPEIETVIINENYREQSEILGDKESTIYGKGFIKENLLDKEFRVSSKTFFPVNPIQAERFYKKAIDYAQLTGTEIVLDAYAGIGTIGVLVSGKVRKVISVESNPNAVRDAISNIKRNQIKNVDIYTKNAAEFVKQVAESEKQPVEVVFVDPPQAGCDKTFLDALVTLAPQKVVYISHNLTSLEKDLHGLSERGFRVKKATGIDILPWTDCVDVVILLQR